MIIIKTYEKKNNNENDLIYKIFYFSKFININIYKEYFYESTFLYLIIYNIHIKFMV